ncbi:zinc metalloprotease [Spirochaetia bacterium]|nr:zinc metalloprotease [Spirochaetia bacterium]
MILKIILGLIGLGIVVLIHETGHFLAARFFGIGVEAFSIGMGPVLLHKKIGETEYRISLFPIGGYCKMSGENDFKKSWENFKNNIKEGKNTFLGASPGARMAVAGAGPFFNIVFAVIVFAFIYGTGFEYPTMENRIVLVQDVHSDAPSTPAQEAGLLTGDRIIKIGRKNVENYRDIQIGISINAKTNLPVTVERGDKTMVFNLKPALEKSTGAGKIGVYYWADPVIAEVESGSASDRCGLKNGDRILKVNDEPIEYSVALFKVLDAKPKELNIEFLRGGEILNTTLAISEDPNESFGFSWQGVHYKTPKYSLPGAIARGCEEAWMTLTTSVKSLGLLFGGVDLTQAVSGPVRITYMVGDVATEGFKQSAGVAFRNIFNFLALISIAVAVTNLLPLPILDGGLILIFFVELLRRKPLNPLFIQVFQTAGIVLLAGLMVFGVFVDVKFLVKGG